MHHQQFRLTLMILAAFSQPLCAASLEVFTGVVGGSNTGCSGAGGPVSAIDSFFGDLSGFGMLSGGNGIGSCGLSGAVNDVSQTTGPLSSTYNLASVPFSLYPANSFNGTATATADFGSVSAGASNTVNGVPGYEGSAQSAAFAIASDTLNVGGVATAAGYMAFDFTLNGSITVGNPNNGYAGQGQMQVQVQAGGNSETIFYSNVLQASVYEGGIQGVNGTLYAGQPITGCVTGAGTLVCANATLQTFLMPVSFVGGSVAFNFGLIDTALPAAYQTVTVDPPDMSLSGIQVYDANGNLVPNFTITSGSGTAYGADGVESGTPEPATLPLTATALIALAGMSTRRRFH